MGGVDLDGKSFRIVRNDGDAPETVEGTIVRFAQAANIVSAEWSDRMVRSANLIGVVEGTHLRHAYIVINNLNEIRTGRGTADVEVKKDGKLRIVEAWDWTDPPGRGLCTMDEI